MWRVGLLLCLVAGSRPLSITEFSVPTSIKSGEDVELKCKYELNKGESERALFVKWWWTPLNSSGDERSQLYQRIAGHVADVLHHNIEIEENDNIRVLNVTHKDSGTYECEVSNIDEIRSHGDMIVFTDGDGPQLHIIVVEDEADGSGDDDDDDDNDNDKDLLLTCEANDVAPEPELLITFNGVLINDVKENVSTPEDGLFDVFATVRVSRSDADGADLSCELVFKDANITHPQYIDTEKYYSDENALSTTESTDDPTTPEVTSLLIENESDGGTALASCFFLVLAALSLQLTFVN